MQLCSRPEISFKGLNFVSFNVHAPLCLLVMTSFGCVLLFREPDKPRLGFVHSRRTEVHLGQQLLAQNQKLERTMEERGTRIAFAFRRDGTAMAVGLCMYCGRSG